MRFSDGMSIDMEGPLRVIHKRDGYYVTGLGTLCAVESYQEGIDLIRELTGEKNVNAK